MNDSGDEERSRTWRTLSKVRRDESRSMNVRAQNNEARAAELRRQAKDALERVPLIARGLNEAVRRRLEIDHRERARGRAERLLKEAQALEQQARTHRELALMSARTSSIFDRLEARTLENERMRRRKSAALVPDLSPASEGLLRTWPPEQEEAP